MAFNINNYNIDLVDATDLLTESILPDWIDYRSEFNITESNKRVNIRVFYHFFIKHICEYLLSLESGTKKIIYINYNRANNTNIILQNRIEALGYDAESFFYLLNGLIIKLERYFPFKFYISRYKKEALLKLLEEGDGHAINQFNMLRSKIDVINNRAYQFSKINQFIKRYELTWLDDNFFSNIKTKMLIIK